MFLEFLKNVLGIRRLLALLISGVFLFNTAPGMSLFKDALDEMEITLHEGFDPASGNLYTTSAVNFRSGPSTADDVLAVLEKDTEVVVIGQSGSWMQVVVNGVPGFVSKDFLKDEVPAVIQVPPIAPIATESITKPGETSGTTAPTTTPTIKPTTTPTTKPATTTKPTSTTKPTTTPTTKPTTAPTTPPTTAPTTPPTTAPTVPPTTAPTTPPTQGLLYPGYPANYVVYYLQGGQDEPGKLGYRQGFRSDDEANAYAFAEGRQRQAEGYIGWSLSYGALLNDGTYGIWVWWYK